MSSVAFTVITGALGLSATPATSTGMSSEKVAVSVVPAAVSVTRVKVLSTMCPESGVE